MHRHPAQTSTTPGILEAQNSLVIETLESVERLSFRLELLCFGCIFHLSEERGIDIDRMQGHNRDTRIGIGVSPGAGGPGIVDRQQLYHALLCDGGPIYQLSDIGKITYTIASFTS